ncbi:post-GPI attachment to proteins factor 2-like isoform X1 [Dunckerocampus dactyliophorus]|uniref:post-GPI attachment to proteins factor 2-like isoform X1 n=1 Tax=Dunckerocampus dactyliophorus TaxID=161453 RepID=UPI002405EBEE|nr:post-GPI attachment to proteins factor 2-like isoform X1 [Dunckerocampus dactyliophorus]
MIPGFYDHERPLVIRISFTTFVLCTVCLPLLGLIACVLISSVYHFDESTKTHCYVPNYLPSISASISQSPECHIWRFCIGLHSAPRFLVAFIYFKFYKMCFTSKFPERSLAYLSLAFSVLENLGLLLLSYVSSKETYLLHQEGFILFILSSLIYMLITCRLWKTIKRYSLNPEVSSPPPTPPIVYMTSYVCLFSFLSSQDAKSHHWKVRFLLLNVCFSAFAGFFYVKHNLYCESGIYTFFALFEYLTVFSNMAFHLTAVWDFRSREVMVISSSEDKDF